MNNEEGQKKIFASNIQYLLDRCGKSQREVAHALEVSPQVINTWVRGKSIPGAWKIQEIAEYFDCSMDDLMRVSFSSQEKPPYRAADSGKSYYFSEETADMAQELFENPNTRMLFDAARDARPEDLQMAADMLQRFKRTNPDG